jgi:hypothetical protein
MSVDDSKPKVTTEVCPPRPESEELHYEPPFPLDLRMDGKSQY